MHNMEILKNNSFCCFKNSYLEYLMKTQVHRNKNDYSERNSNIVKDIARQRDRLLFLANSFSNK